MTPQEHALWLSSLKSHERGNEVQALRYSDNPSKREILDLYCGVMLGMAKRPCEKRRWECKRKEYAEPERPKLDIKRIKMDPLERLAMSKPWYPGGYSAIG